MGVTAAVQDIDLLPDADSNGPICMTMKKEGNKNDINKVGTRGCRWV